MNQAPENETETIRSEIDDTRRRMDDTMGAIGDRLQGRHLLDEILGFFRSDNPKGSEFREKISETASSAAGSIGNAIKSNPMPVVLIGAGIAWMIYESRRKPSDGRFADEYDDEVELYGQSRREYPDPDYTAEYDRPLEYGSGEAVGETSSLGYMSESGLESGEKSGGDEMKDQIAGTASRAKQQVKQKLSRAGEAVKEKTQDVTRKARELGYRAQDSAKQVYSRTREQVVTTTREHPLEVGLGVLAAGVLAGLLLPTPQKVNRIAGPTVDRLRERTRSAGNELLEKGQRVAQAAASAAKTEAEKQGLTIEGMKEKAEAIAQEAGEASTHAARQEGLVNEENQSGTNPV